MYCVMTDWIVDCSSDRNC